MHAIMFGKLLQRHCLRILCNKIPTPQLLTCHESTYQESDASALTTVSRNDPVVLALKSARSTGAALEVIGIHASHMSPDQVAFSLRTLCNLQKSASSNFGETDVLNSEEFLFLCRRLKKHCAVLEINQVLDAFKTVTLFKVPHNSAITMRLLHLIKRDINLLSVSQIIFLTFLLRQYPRDPVVDALKIALPVVFETQLRTKLDRTNVPTLVDALMFCSRNHVSREATNHVVHALSEIDQLDWVTMDPRRARLAVLALCTLETDSPACVTVFREAMDVVANSLNRISFKEVEALLAATMAAMKRVPYAYHAPLFDAAAEAAVSQRWDQLQCNILLRKLNLLGVVSIKLLDLMADRVLEDPEMIRDGKFGTLKPLVCGLSIASYKTDHWHVLKDLIPASRFMQHVQPKEPWMALCLELASLDLYNDKLLAQVFSPAFLGTYLAREYNKLDLLQLLRLYQAVTVLHSSYSGPRPSATFLQQAEAVNGANVAELPLRGALNSVLGPQRVLSRCRTDLGHFIDHVAVVQPGGDAWEFPQQVPLENANIDQLDIPSNCLRVAVLLLPPSSLNSLKQLRGTSALNVRVLEALGWAVVPVAHDAWRALPDYEKGPYLLHKIQLKIPQLNHNEAAND